MIARLEQRGLKSEVEDNGRVFPSTKKAKDVLALLLVQTMKNTTDIFLDSEVLSVEKIQGHCEERSNPENMKIDCHSSLHSLRNDEGIEPPLSPLQKGTESYFLVKTPDKEFKTKKLIIATGGKSFPNTGTTGFAYQIAQQLDLKIVNPYPALCGIETGQNFAPLSGSTANAKITIFHKDKILEQKE